MSTAFREHSDSRMAAREVFAEYGYVLLPKLIDCALAEFFWSYVHTKFACYQLTTGDSQVPNSPRRYGDPTFDGLLEYLRAPIEAASGARLHPTYSYFRFYKHGDELKRHHDRAACEFSVSLNIGQTPSGCWPLNIESRNGPYAARLSPGDAVLYRGIDCYHWRDRYEGERLVQVFLHYVDADGPHADQKFDGRMTLMRPNQEDRAQLDQAART